MKAFVGLMMLLLLLAGVAISGQGASDPPKIVAQDIAITDSQGQVRMRLAVGVGDMPIIEMFDKDGRQRLVCGQISSTSWGFVIVNDEKRELVNLGADEANTWVVLTTENGHAVRMMAENKRGAATVSLHTDLLPEVTLRTTKEDSSLIFWRDKGMIAALLGTRDGDPRMKLMSPDGVPRINQEVLHTGDPRLEVRNLDGARLLDIR